ncbi:hypothetical protein pb186bvf_006267 [Paramecium bursaria]
MSTNTKNKDGTQVTKKRKGRRKRVEKIDVDQDGLKIEYTYQLRKKVVKSNKKVQKRVRRKQSTQMIDQTKKQVKLQNNVKEEEKMYVNDAVQVESPKYGQIFTHFQVGSNQVYFLVNKNETFIEDLRAKPESVEGIIKVQLKNTYKKNYLEWEN